ncbi:MULTISPECIES: hypothetical protein [Natrialbaceae]|uniref:hypothetical protein n=1 Tax=Natrialbaceae TaxID=1644061 RepID=UPI00207D16EC|nr:hypothetical protein [Natronococcus sp. CG52]
MSDDRPSETNEAHIDSAVLERTTDRSEVDAETITDALVVLHSALIGRHAEFEREHDYATVGGTRAYRVPETVWDDLVDEFEFEDEVATAVKFAHTEQAQLAFTDAVSVDDRFDEGEFGVVVGIDTAEEF